MTIQTLDKKDAAPFRFDVNFAAPKPKKQVVEEEVKIPTITVPEHETVVAAVRDEGYQAGLADGKKGEESRLADEARRLADAAQKILTAIDEDRRKLEAETAGLALAIANRLAKGAISQFPTEEIEKLIRDCLGPLRKTPHLVVRLNEKDADAITQTVGKFVREQGFEGRFMVLGEPDIERGDCRIEWADGGIIRDRQKAFGEISDLMQNYFAPHEVMADDADDTDFDADIVAGAEAAIETGAPAGEDDTLQDEQAEPWSNGEMQ